MIGHLHGRVYFYAGILFIGSVPGLRSRCSGPPDANYNFNIQLIRMQSFSVLGVRGQDDLSSEAGSGSGQPQEEPGPGDVLVELNADADLPELAEEDETKVEETSDEDHEHLQPEEGQYVSIIDDDYYGDNILPPGPEVLHEAVDASKPGLEDPNKAEAEDPTGDETGISNETDPDDFPELAYDGELDLDQSLISGQPDVGPALPEMVTSNSKDVIKVGESVQLTCRVKNLGLFEVRVP